MATDGGQRMKAEKTGRRRWSPGMPDKVFMGALGALIVLIVVLSILQRCGLTPVKGEIMLYLPLLAMFVLVGWGVYALVRRIKNRTVRLLVGGGVAMVLVLVLVIGFTYISYMGFYVIPQRYTALTSPSGAHKLLVMRTFDTDEERVQARKAARLEANPDDGEEERIEDWGYLYRAYPPALGLFYRSNANVEGEVCLAINDYPAATEAAEAEKPAHGTLMVEWLDDEATAHLFVADPGVADGGDCYVRF